MNFNNVDIGLLRFCLKHGDGTKDSTPLQRDPKDYEWLRAAMNDLESDAQKMKKCLEMIQQEGVSSEQKLFLLEELQYNVEDEYHANDFCKIGGLPILLQLLKDSHEGVRFWTCWVLGTVVQNNPEAQHFTFEKGLLSSIMVLMLSEPSPEVKEKALFVLSGIIKDFPEAQEQFLRQDGLNRLGSFLQHSNPSTRMKAAFIISQLLTERPKLVSDILQLNLIAPIVAMVDDPNEDAREKAIQLLEKLLVQSQSVMKRCETLGLQKIINERIQNCREEGKNESDHAISLLLNLKKVLIIQQNKT